MRALCGSQEQLNYLLPDLRQSVSPECAEVARKLKDQLQVLNRLLTRRSELYKQLKSTAERVTFVALG